MSGYRRLLLLPLALLGIAAGSEIPWEEMTEADWPYSIATRFATVGGHRVHYPTPTVELAQALEASREHAALRHLAEARRALGDIAGAEAALERWAEGAGGAADAPAAPERAAVLKARAWEEVARWGADHRRLALAFRAAEKAFPGLPPDERRALADRRVAWADAHPDDADPLSLRKARAEMFPGDQTLLEDWIKALEKAGRLEEAEKALAAATALSRERRLLLRSAFLADHAEHGPAFEALDAELLSDGALDWSIDFRRMYAARVDKGDPSAPERWRATLEKAFDALALARLSTYFQGHDRGGSASDLLRQVELRYEKGLDRAGLLLLARLHELNDAVPESFRARLSAAQQGTPAERTADLAPLCRLALRAGGRPLAWGTYNDEPYRWVARLDRTPGFWTGGLSFLLTGQDWGQALARLETESLPDRTFTTARLLADELARRAPDHPELAPLRVAIMERHVERGEGRQALALLPRVEAAGAAIADEGRRVALLAARQVEVPLEEELRLHRLRLKAAAPDGSRPRLGSLGEAGDAPEEGAPPAAPVDHDGNRYRTVLEEALSRLELRDRSHRTSVGLLLAEMDRLPDAEDLWADLASRLEGWNLDDELGPRYERALKQFRDASWWSRAARWYARRSRQVELRRLAEDIAARFRGADLFARAQADVALEIPEQPPVGGRVRLIPWADWVRLKALERFPHSPTVVREAVGHLLTRRAWEKLRADRGDASLAKQRVHPPVIDDSLLETRQFAVLFVDGSIRDVHLAQEAAAGTLESMLGAMEAQAERTPVQDLLLFEGWSRLSRFERAAPFADRLAAAYPGDGDLAHRALTLHRSLAGLDPSHARPAREVVTRTAPALVDADALWTELGELEHDRGRADAALSDWRKILDADPRDPQRISGLATLLWDYGHMAEALAVVEEGRRRIGRPRYFAFETGVLREEVKDIHGAVDEYLAALWPEGADCCREFEGDQRSLRRLAQLLGRERVLTLVLARIDSMRPGVRAEEEAFAAFLPLARMALPEPGLDYTVDDWIDEMDLPRDPVGRQQRAEARAAARPGEHRGIDRLTDRMLEKAGSMVAAASRPELLDAVESWAGPLMDRRWDKDHAVGFRSAVMARRAALAPTEEDRIAREVQRARYLAENGRRDESDALWKGLSSRIASLPEGVARMRAEAEHAGYVERTRGAEAAAEEWRALHDRYPWSLGVLEDRLDFLARAGRGADGRRVLAAVIPRAAQGHRELLLGRLTREALAASDLPQARGAVDQLLRLPGLEESQRLYAVHLLARLSFKEGAAFDPMPLARAEAEKLAPERQPDLYATLAQAADEEKAWSPAVTLWIEALNRRTERAWLERAARSAEKAGRFADLLGFFDRQRLRSPRDVRWAVAVRDLKRHARDIAGAIEMAKAAVAVRPEQEDLWREAVDLMVRADRVGEAAEYLEGWNRPRAADEEVARWRGGLFARAGRATDALAVEQAALAAFAREGKPTTDRREELRQRTARAARRVSEYGYPRLAWTLLGGPSLSKVTASAYAPHEQFQLALLTGNFVRLLRLRLGAATYRTAAASVLQEYGRPESKEDAQAFLLAELFPAQGPPHDLDEVFSLVQEAGMESRFRVAFAQRVVRAAAGPWQASPSVPFLESVGRAAIDHTAQPDGGRRWTFREPDLNALWVREIVRKDDGAALVAFVGPRWTELVAQVRSETALPRGTERVAWAAWLDDPQALSAWARAARTDPGIVSDLSSLFSGRREWDRLWTLAARGWTVSSLVQVLPAEARTAWFRFWQRPPAEPDPVRAARDETLEAAALAVGRLVAGAPGATADPLIDKLRGPRTVGEVLGGDARWVWSEFTPRRGPNGEIAEAGEERVFGQRADLGRVPGALWGERPGEAWYVLEALARYRGRDAMAPLVPVEVPERAGQSQRAFVAIRMAEALGQGPLALELEQAFPGRSQDLTWLEMRLRLLVNAGQKEKAQTLLRDVVRKDQASLTEARFRSLTGLAQDFGLAAPLDDLDPATPLTPGFLAYLFDRRGADTAARFTTRDEVGFRAALASRWTPRQRTLTADQVRYALRRLWAEGAMDLPRAGLRRLGGIWPFAAEWLARQRKADRAEALAALEALPDTARFDTAAARQPEDDVVRLLRLRILLARNEDARAVALVDELLRGLSSDSPLTYEPPAPAPAPEPTEAEEGEDEEAPEEPAEEPAPTAAPADALTARLEAWLAPFRDVARAAPVENRFRALLASRRAEGPVSIDAWRLAFELTPSAADRAALLTDVERAWIRGDWSPEGLGPLVEVLARLAPEEAPRWLRRWPATFDYAHVSARAHVHDVLSDPAAAMEALVDGRRRGLWSAADEIHAFDTWRRAARAARAPAPATRGLAPPAAWTAALPFWKGQPNEVVPALGRHLAAHPYDIRAARAALRSPAGGEEEALRRAALALDDPTMESLGGLQSDATLLRVRIARGLLRPSAAPRAAHLALGPLDPAALARDLGRRRIARAEVDTALADVARIATRAEDAALRENTMAVLIDRKVSSLKAIRAELRVLGRPDTPPAAFRVVGGAPAPYRPRDLTWAVVAAVLTAEEAR